MSRGHDYKLESLRGVAALSVAIFHTGYAPVTFSAGTVGPIIYSPAASNIGPGWLNLAYTLITNGQGAVIVFFVLSGHVLMQSLQRESECRPATGFRFILRRLVRIYPPFVAMIGVCWALFMTTGQHIHGSLPEDFSGTRLLQQISLYRSNINGVAWTLQVELVAALLVLICWMAYRAFGLVALIGALLAFLAISFTQDANWVIELVLIPQFPYTPFLYAFVAGMLIGDWLRFLNSIAVPRLLLRIYPLAGLLLICTSPQLFGVVSKFRFVGEVLGAAALIAGIGLNANPAMNRLLDTRVLRFYGRISYSFYLFHPLTLLVTWQMPDFLGRIINAGAPPAFVALVLSILSIAFITPIAVLSHRYIELPSVAAGKLLTRRKPTEQTKMDALATVTSNTP